MCVCVWVCVYVRVKKCVSVSVWWLCTSMALPTGIYEYGMSRMHFTFRHSYIAVCDTHPHFVCGWFRSTLHTHPHMNRIKEANAQTKGNKQTQRHAKLHLPNRKSFHKKKKHVHNIDGPCQTTNGDVHNINMSLHKNKHKNKHNNIRIYRTVTRMNTADVKIFWIMQSKNLNYAHNTTQHGPSAAASLL